MWVRICILVAVALAVSSAGQAAGTSTEDAAEKLISATVTVRAVTAPVAETKEVMVCSGVSLGRGLIVTFQTMPASDSAMPR
jgi:hypothetical protein